MPPEPHDLQLAAEAYQAGSKLVAAVNVALVVGAPLLVTGEPGTGKTALAYWLKPHFGLADDQLLRFDVRSTSVAEELLWPFDTVRYVHDGQDPTRKGSKLEKADHREKGPLWKAFDLLRERRAAFVLIDEIDKAPRDFPNDLLHELDEFALTCKPTNEEITRPKGVAPPLVVNTSNSERRLREPFLRRCIFHYIELDEPTVRLAVQKRTSGWDPAKREAALTQQFFANRGRGLRKPPSTGELLHWIAVLTAGGTPRRSGP